MSASLSFSHVDSSIAKILSFEAASSLEAPLRNKRLDKQGRWLLPPCGSDTTVSLWEIHDLIFLARDCDAYVFDSKGEIDNPLVQLVQKYPDYTLLASLLALNGLEAAIRQATGFSTARAPLLKHMLGKLDLPDDFSQVLRLVLLPNGLNLRNLVWHGFVPDLPRPWLALLIWLQRQVLDSNGRKDTESDEISLPNALTELSAQHDRLNLVVQKGRCLIDALDEASPAGPMQRVNDWLPESHRSLWKTTVQLLQKPKCCWLATSLLLLLLEHGLRMEWCACNNRPQDLKAKAGAYFTTLDGHGQKHLHNVLLYPVVYNHNSGDEEEKNQLISRVGANTMALLSDLLLSPAGGPNVRAALSHGLMDDLLGQQVQGLLLQKDAKQVGYCSILTGEQAHADVAAVLVLAMVQVADRDRSFIYRPVFSFTAMVLHDLDILHALIGQLGESSKGQFGIEKTTVLNLSQGVSQRLNGGADSLEPWTERLLHQEYAANQKLVNVAATRTLLNELAGNIDRFLSSRRPSDERISDFFLFATYVCLASLSCALKEDASVSLQNINWKKAVQRTRMVASTVDTFLQKNVERGTNAIGAYAKGRIVKEIFVVYKQDDVCTNAM